MIGLIIAYSTIATASPQLLTPPATLLKREEIKFRICEKIYFDGHTYIHLRNMYTGADAAWLHDPSCECLVKVEKK